MVLNSSRSSSSTQGGRAPRSARAIAWPIRSPSRVRLARPVSASLSAIRSSVQPGLIESGGPFGNPLFQRLVDGVQFLGQQVDAGDHCVHRVPAPATAPAGRTDCPTPVGRSDRPARRAACRQSDRSSRPSRRNAIAWSRSVKNLVGQGTGLTPRVKFAMTRSTGRTAEQGDPGRGGRLTEHGSGLAGDRLGRRHVDEHRPTGRPRRSGSRRRTPAAPTDR